MVLNEHMGDLPKTFRFATGSPYDFSETKRILLALTRLIDRDANCIDWSLKENSRLAYRAICEAAEQVEIDLSTRLTAALYEADPAKAEKIACDHAGNANLDAGIGDRIAGLREALSHANVDRGWRDILIALRDRKITLREAVRAHPSIRYALRSGLLALRDTPSHNKAIRRALRRELRRSSFRNTQPFIRHELLDQKELQLLSGMGTRWLHLLEQNTRILRLAIVIFLGDPVFRDPGGRPGEPEVERFVKRFLEICRTFSGKRPTASLYGASFSGAYGGAQRPSAGLLLLEACLVPLGYNFGWERCKELLLEALKLED